jgi:1-acyl-sn-glycerol-3-phosphate acyltransferase
MAKLTPTYRLAMAVSTPPVRWWGRLEVSGLEHLPAEGPVLLAGNHDSYWDTVAIGLAAMPRRPIHALAKSELWKFPGLAPVLDGMGQIPVRRNASDVVAFQRAVEDLRAGGCIGVFPEGTRSRGRELRARSGFGRLADLVPEAEVVLVSILDTATIVAGFPTRRPRIRARFFRPEGGPKRPDESASEFSARLLEEIRREAPRVACGRKGEVPPMPDDPRVTVGSSAG